MRPTVKTTVIITDCNGDGYDASRLTAVDHVWEDAGITMVMFDALVSTGPGDMDWERCIDSLDNLVALHWAKPLDNVVTTA